MRVGARVSAVTASMFPEGSSRRGAGRDGGRAGRRSARGSGRVLADRDAPDFGVRLSKRMSHLLRHGAVEAGLGDAMDASGHVPVRDVLALPRFAGITEADVRRLVANCPKRRFELRGPSASASASDAATAATFATAATPASTSSLSIRATQGHSMSSKHTRLDDARMLTRLDERAAAIVSEAAHGTSVSAWAKIRTDGVRRMKRRHVHMARATSLPDVAFGPVAPRPVAFERAREATRATRATDGETDRGARRTNEENGGGFVSGFRADARVAVWVDVARGVREGVPFFLSANDVVLSPGEGDTGAIPPRLFLRAVDLKTGETLAL